MANDNLLGQNLIQLKCGNAWRIYESNILLHMHFEVLLSLLACNIEVCSRLGIYILLNCHDVG